MDQSGRLALREHHRQPWRIHALANDFGVEDVWALSTPGGPDDFPRLLDVMTAFDPEAASPVLRALFAARWKLGGWLGLDRPDTGLDQRVPSLRTRLPADLANSVAPDVVAPFRGVYATDREAALEIANGTVHGVMHLGWVPDGRGGYRGQMAVLVKPNGVLGRVYLAAIAPFRYAVVYPVMLRAIAREWTTSVHRISLPGFASEASRLPRIDYADAFSVDVGAHRGRTAEQWARAILEEADGDTRLPAGWTALGLRVDDENGIAGWRILHDDADTVLLGADSRIGMPGELFVAVRGDEVTFATMLHHRTAATRPIWAAVLPAHLATVRRLLSDAAGVRVTSVRR
jgi:hypothetical protein